MKVFYTKTYNLSGANARKQNNIEITARNMGFDELSFFRFQDRYDSDDELNVRMDGIMAAMEDGAVVIFQYPSMVSLRYDKCAVDHIKKYRDVKLVIMVEDLGCVVNSEGYDDLDAEIRIFNQADLLILQSETMHTQLISRGLDNISIIYQEVWDYPYEIVNNDVQIENKIQYITDTSISSMIDLKRSGIAILGDMDNVYLDICNLLEVGFCICAGIPMLAKKGSRMAQFLETYKIGFVIEYQTNPEEFIHEISGAQIEEKKRHLRRLQSAVSSGLFTRTLLQQAIYMVCINCFIQ